jgi:hypothetical protein
MPADSYTLELRADKWWLGENGCLENRSSNEAQETPGFIRVKNAPFPFLLYLPVYWAEGTMPVEPGGPG